ncbi:MAG: NAD-binding protein [Planctomycetes bacterium]|nr:NAD-binding protein [Planctomycetota bacterium]
MSQRVLLCGLGRVGWRVLDSVRAAGFPVVVIDTNIAPDDPRLNGVRAVRGDCRRPDVLELGGVRDATGIVIATGDDLLNISTAMLVRKLNPTARIVVRMFNQNLIDRLSGAVKNTVALSVSGLIAPMLALTAVTGDTLGAFKLEDGPRQVSELAVAAGSSLIGMTIGDVAQQNQLVPLAFTPAHGHPSFLHDVPSDTALSQGDRLVVCGAPANLIRLLERERGDLLPGVKWAWRLRRWLRTFRRTLWEVDLSVKIATPVLFATILGSVFVFRYGIGAEWSEGLYQTVSIIATGASMHGEHHSDWAKVFISVLKLAGAALIAAFTAIFTQYLLRAKLGGALEIRWVPDGGHVVVCGLGNVGFRLVNELIAMGERVVAIDNRVDGQFIATVRGKGVPTFVGDATVVDVLKQARAGDAKAVIAATSSELANLEIALLVREMNPNSRVVVRLSDPEFAEAVREAANIRQAVSVPALAAPAFAAALFGDRVQTLITAAGRTLVVIELAVDADDTHLVGKSLRALMLDYRLMPVAIAGHNLAELREHRFKLGDRVTVVAELPDLERLIRREAIPRTASTVIDSYPVIVRDKLVLLVRSVRRCEKEEAEAAVNGPFTLADGLTHGEAQELVELVSRDKCVARVIVTREPGIYAD